MSEVSPSSMPKAIKDQARGQSSRPALAYDSRLQDAATRAIEAHPDNLYFLPQPDPRPGSLAGEVTTTLSDSVRKLELAAEVSAERIQELELAAEISAERIRELERELSAMAAFNDASTASPRGHAPAFPPSSPLDSDNDEWRARTEARVRLFCSLNRAGNALCGWHDCRRERRAFPPRMAPPGYLNCGCAYEEALFEESLARNGVGGYLPGETVRMDPALRQPLLRLLQERYGYRDGDFERDRDSGEWVEGEGARKWEEKVAVRYPGRPSAVL